MKAFLSNTWRHRAHVVMSLPALLLLLLFNYIPMAGLVMAFKNYDYGKGIWGSPWVGLDNFRILITSGDIFARMTMNTLFYYGLFTVVGTTLSIIIAISIDQLVFKRAGKAFQSIMIIPIFISFAAVQFIVYAFFSNHGMLNNIMEVFGIHSVRWYTSAKYWPWILLTVKIWNSVGYGSVLYMSVLSGIDQQLYEAAQIDGANKIKQIFKITIPSLMPMVTIMLLLSVGGIMRSDTGLFYQVTRNSGILYSKTQVIDSYVLNAILTTPDYGFTAATTFYQSVVGLVLIILANAIVKRIAPENALF